MSEKYIRKYAQISGDGLYRYQLDREWRGTHDPKNWRWLETGEMSDPYGDPKACLFVMLNPSTADAEIDDPTIRRCVGFAKSWNYELLQVVNLFAFRATKPTDLFAMYAKGDPVGPRNQEVIGGLAHDAGIIVCAWGAHGGFCDQNETMRGWLTPYEEKLFALGFTKEGHPRHPLYAPANSTLVRMPA